MKQILITGANGNLGGSLVKELTDNTDYGVIAISSDKQKVCEMLDRENVANRENVIALNQEEFFKLETSDIFAAVHMAFSRSNKPNQDIALSLDYTTGVYKKLKELNVPKVIYLSSQSVYGSISDWRTESCNPAPDAVYPMAKYAGEKLLELMKFPEYSILRLDYVIQSQRLVPVLCQNANAKKTIKLKGGKQTFSYIDRTDVAKAIVALLDSSNPWKPVYNVGPNRMRYTLMEIAEVVKTVAEKHGVEGVTIDLEENDTELWSGMDSSLFMHDTGWKPSMDIYQMVEKLYIRINGVRCTGLVHNNDSAHEYN